MKRIGNKIFMGLCIGLVVASAIFAIDYGMKGQYKEMHNSINWVLWIGNTILMIILLERKEVEIEVKDSYIESLEKYKELTDNHIVSLKELYQAQKDYSTGLEDRIKDYKKLNTANEKIIEQYKNSKPSRF